MYAEGEMNKPRNIEEQLRQAILGAGVSRYAMAKKTGVSEGILSRFVRGERTLRLDTAARLAAALGLRLTDALPKQPKAKRSTTKKGGAKR